MSGRFSEGFWRLDHLHIQVLLYCIVLSSLPTDSSLFFSDISKESFTGAGVQAGQWEEQEEASEQGRERCSMLPPYIQMFYQYGDIQLAAAQDILADSKVG